MLMTAIGAVCVDRQEEVFNRTGCATREGIQERAAGRRTAASLAGTK
jgi:hypothetical protein